jgi:hypothetical protein
MSDRLTLISTECDPSCKWRQSIDELTAKKAAEIDAIDTEPYNGNPDDIRPTIDGYMEYDRICERFQGLTVFEQVGVNCVRACAIERYFDTEPSIGTELQEVNNDLKGN